MGSIIVNLDDDNWRLQSDFEKWQSQDNLDHIFNAVINKVYGCPKPFEANLLLSNDDVVQPLNERFLGKDSTTNVLSFPQFEDLSKLDTPLDGDKILIGDIIMSYNKIMRESIEFNFRFFDRVTHLLVHSTLHLLGFDHINNQDRQNMESLEIDILKNLGLKNPYIID